MARKRDNVLLDLVRNVDHLVVGLRRPSRLWTSPRKEKSKETRGYKSRGFGVYPGSKIMSGGARRGLMKWRQNPNPELHKCGMR